MENQQRIDEVLTYLSAPLRATLEKLPSSYKEGLTEIRLRAEQPVILVYNNQCMAVELDGTPTEICGNSVLICSYECLEQTFRRVCGYSVHTHQKEIARGYITLKGGHRVGLCGTGVEQGEQIGALKEISSLNIRIARQVFGVATPLIPLAQTGGLLLVGRPASGKTTLLRDLARQLSGKGQVGKKIVLLDERGELAAMWDGIPQNQVGCNTDVLSGISKSIGLEMAIRGLSPDVVICDEIGSRKEAEGLLGCMHAGVQVIASVHSASFEELSRKPWVMALLRAGVFERLALLSSHKGKGQIERTVKTDDWLAEMGGSFFDGNHYSLGRIGDCLSL